MARRWAGALKQCRAMASAAAPPPAAGSAEAPRTRASLIPMKKGEVIRWGGKLYVGPVHGKTNLLRLEYEKQVKELRKEYRAEVEAKRIEKKRLEAEEREKLAGNREQKLILKWQKKELKRINAQEQREAERAIIERLRRTRALSREKMLAEHQAGRNKKLEALRESSSSWIEEKDLESRIHEALVDPIPLLRTSRPMEPYETFGSVPSSKGPQDPLLRDDDDELLSAFGKKSPSRITGRDILASAARATSKLPF